MSFRGIGRLDGCAYSCFVFIFYGRTLPCTALLSGCILVSLPALGMLSWTV